MMLIWANLKPFGVRTALCRFNEHKQKYKHQMCVLSPLHHLLLSLPYISSAFALHTPVRLSPRRREQPVFHLLFLLLKPTPGSSQRRINEVLHALTQPHDKRPSRPSLKEKTCVHGREWERAIKQVRDSGITRRTDTHHTVRSTHSLTHTLTRTHDGFWLIRKYNHRFTVWKLASRNGQNMFDFFHWHSSSTLLIIFLMIILKDLCLTAAGSSSCC